MSDAINPSHYQFSKGVQVIDITENLTSNGGQAVQYIARATRLDGLNKGSQVEDLEKAVWFIRREIDRLNGERLRRNPESLERLRRALSSTEGDAPAPVARVFATAGDIPADVKLVVDNEGETWSREGSGLMADWEGPVAGDRDNKYAPFTEVIR